jgi:hypothetical protein
MFIFLSDSIFISSVTEKASLNDRKPNPLGSAFQTFYSWNPFSDWNISWNLTLS